jgi:hypothetical protein
MDSTARYATWPGPMGVAAIGNRDPDVGAVAPGGDLAALNRLSATLAPICAALSKHLASPAGDDERILLEPLATAVGDTFVAVRLARLGVQARLAHEGNDSERSHTHSGAESLCDATIARLHRIQWNALEFCHEFLTEWEDVQVSTPEMGDRLRKDVKGMVERIGASLLEIEFRDRRSRVA